MINSHFHSLIRSETNILFQMSFFIFSALPPKLTMRPKSLGTNAIMRITDQQQSVGRASCELILAGQCRGKWQSLRLLLGRQKREQEQVPHPTLSPASPLPPCILLSSLQLGFSFFFSTKCAVRNQKFNNNNNNKACLLCLQGEYATVNSFVFFKLIVWLTCKVMGFTVPSSWINVVLNCTHLPSSPTLFPHSCWFHPHSQIIPLQFSCRT